MNRFLTGVFVAALAFNSIAVQAKRYALTVNGSVTRLSGYYNGQVTPPPPSILNLGDEISFRVTFDTINSTLAPLYDLDPTINIYYLNDANIHIKIGAYRSNFTPAYSSNALTQIWDNYRSGSNLVDSQYFEFFHYNFTPTSQFPFNLGLGTTSEMFTMHNFDSTGLARNSDLISEFAPLSAFGSRSFSYSLYNSTLGTFGFVSSNNLETSLSAIPELPTWATLVVGFGLTGAALRRRQIDREEQSSAS